MFVRIQLLRIPGDERKFRRRRIVASIPTCKREREVTASHTSKTVGASDIGVAVASITGVALISKVFVGKGVAACVGEGRGVSVLETATVASGVFVPVTAGVELAASVDVLVAKVA